MHIGHNCFISDKWIPHRLPTGLKDINGLEIKTGHNVSLKGCSSACAVIGKTTDGFMLYFGSENGSIGWCLDEDTITTHKISITP